MSWKDALLGDSPDQSDTREQPQALVTLRKLLGLTAEFRCNECGAVCEPSRTYDPREAAFYSEYNGKVPSWGCPECGRTYRRDE